jgi:hypothetical protein
VTEAVGSKFSSNEIEQLCLKAARGAGLSWGLAEEAGAAAAWLVLQGIDGPKYLLQLLTLGPLAGPELPWGEQKRLTCPISLGASLCDYVNLPQTNLQDQKLDLGLVAQPALLVPFLSRMAQIKGHALELIAAGPRVVLTAKGNIAFIGAEIPFVAQAKLQLSAMTQVPQTEACLKPCDLSLTAINALNSFAMRTTVPASEASRAGAGASDRDQD